MDHEYVAPVWPRDLIDAFHAKRVVIFAGSGLSCRAKSAGGQSAPTWNGLLGAILKHAVEQRIIRDASRQNELERLIASRSVDDLLIAANYMRDRFRDRGKDLQEFLSQTLSRFRPDEAHSVITTLPVAGYVTTNYDSYIEDEHAKQNRVSLDQFSAHDQESLGAISRTSRPWIVKLHGQVGFSEKFVLSFDEYEAAYSTGRLDTLLSTIFTRYVVLFIGFGFRDPPIMSSMRAIIKRLGNASNRHYAIGDDETLDEIKSRFLTKMFQTESIAFSKLPPRDKDGNAQDPYAHFVPHLKSLRKQVRHDRAPSVRVLLNIRSKEQPETSILFKGSTVITDEEVFLWPSIEWPHLPKFSPVPDLATSTFKNAIRKSFGLDPATSKALEIDQIGRTFIETNKEHLAEAGQSYDFYFQFVCMVVEQKILERILVAMRKLLPGAQQIPLAEVESHEATMSYNGEVLRQLKEL